MTELITSHVLNNNSEFFRKFTIARKCLESFLLEHKSLISGLLQNLNNKVRVAKMRQLFAYLVSEFSCGREVNSESALRHLGIEGKVFDLSFATVSREFSDEAKAKTFVSRAIASAVRCSQCGGLLDAARSVSYDHVIRVREGGLGGSDNCDLTHPYCNDAIKG